MSPTSSSLVLASGSQIRAQMLHAAQVSFVVEKARVDEAMVKASLLAEGHRPRAVADALAEMKAQKISARRPEALVIGCDQVLNLEGEIFDKPATPQDAEAQIRALSGKKHMLHTAAVISEAGQPIWRHVSDVRLTMHPLSEPYIREYVGRNWPAIGQSCGAYQVEAEGIRLFSRIDGDHFAILGLPMIELLHYLTVKGILTR
ncbi:Maf family protein [Pseudooceanicola aestuarii]|uniref:Maf family protein n=1 Tax=Pseudooceanicola aestuarii TaxID=2697319 RepID=UPI0013D1BADE|nr:Maf family nucleotide pyrophosphatase [Pseudooceanicola aestuarii]